MRLQQDSVLKVLGTEPGMQNVFNTCLLVFLSVYWIVQNTADVLKKNVNAYQEDYQYRDTGT